MVAVGLQPADAALDTPLAVLMEHLPASSFCVPSFGLTRACVPPIVFVCGVGEYVLRSENRAVELFGNQWHECGRNWDINVYFGE